ncbi:MAG TPA: FAD-binding oxidoreductase [Myxococcales bacterium]|nr:FAD-binding oxidoreductase [Myxococcales bacterium]
MTARARSYWGWGWADRFPDAAALRALAERVRPFFANAALEPRAAPPGDEVRLPAPRIEVPAALAAFCTSDRDARLAHTYGKSYRDQVRGLRGDFAAAPDLVALPGNEDQIAAVLEWCGARKVAAIPFGGGTSVVGGVEAAVGARYAGALSLDLRGLDRVLEVDPVSRAARIQAGAAGPVLEAQLAAHGFTLRHFPQSFEFSTLGGWIATRAGGHYATLYTHIDDLVESTRMLTPRGVLETRRLPASGAGPNPDRLVLGSEGALGVITEAWMRVTPRPRFRAGASVTFADFAAAVAAAREVAQSGLHPSNCRLLDATEALINGVSADGSAILLLAFESADHALDAWMARALGIARAHGGDCPRGPVVEEESAAAPAEGLSGGWRQAFLEAPYLQSAMISLGMLVDTFETACTWQRFDELHAAILEAVTAALRNACGGGIVSTRFTHVYPDGPAPYYTFLAAARPGAELEQWAQVKKAAADAILAHGGTITHHHGVGRVHRPWYDRERPDAFAAALRAAKSALDPDGILNPGVLVDLR